MSSNREEEPVLRCLVRLPTPAWKHLAYGRAPRWALRDQQLPPQSASNQPFNPNAETNRSLFVSFCAFLWQFLRGARSAPIAARTKRPRIPPEIVALSTQIEEVPSASNQAANPGAY